LVIDFFLNSNYPSLPEFYFDRDARVLRMVLDYLVTGELHNASSTAMCQIYLERELRYWQIDSADMERCCSVEFEGGLVARRGEMSFEARVGEELLKKSTQFGNSETRRKLWCMIEYPNSGNCARVGH
jgi:hypothetical protein